MVLIYVPERCPFDLFSIRQMPIVATVVANDFFTVESAALQHEVRNLVGLPIHRNSTNWVEVGGDRIQSQVIDQYEAGTGGYDRTGAHGYDIWILSQEQIDPRTGVELTTGASALLSYTKQLVASINRNTPFPNPYAPVQLNVGIPAWLPGPYRTVWYRNNEFMGELGENVQVAAGGPSETVSFTVVVTGSDGRQIRGEHEMTSREQACEDPTAIICP
jgi:hypothetical protein